MRVARNLQELSHVTGCVSTLGFFDGVHLGHQAILRRCVDEARRRGLLSAAVTFANHPRSILPGRDAPALLTPLRYRLQLIKEVGVDLALVLDFTTELSQVSRREFVDRFFIAGLQSRHIVLGFNCKFGHEGRGDVQYLQDNADEFKISVESVEPVLINGQAVSSTVIRNLIEDGELERAANKLGRPYSLYGTVRSGDGRGRKIGMPTANLELGNQILPPPGVYAQVAHLADGRRLPCATNIGRRPTFYTDGALTVETHLLDFNGDLLGQDLQLDFVARIRGEQKFPSPEALVAQIHADLDAARALFASKN